jgi:hypothetical protein
VVAVSLKKRLTSALGLSPISMPPYIVALQVASGVLLPFLAAVITLTRHSADAIEG